MKLISSNRIVVTSMRLMIIAQRSYQHDDRDHRTCSNRPGHPIRCASHLSPWTQGLTYIHGFGGSRLLHTWICFQNSIENFGSTSKTHMKKMKNLGSTSALKTHIKFLGLPHKSQTACLGLAPSSKNPGSVTA